MNNGPEGQQDLQSLPNRENSSQEIEIRDIENGSETMDEKFQGSRFNCCVFCK